MIGHSGERIDTGVAYKGLDCHLCAMRMLLRITAYVGARSLFIRRIDRLPCRTGNIYAVMPKCFDRLEVEIWAGNDVEVPLFLSNTPHPSLHSGPDAFIEGWLSGRQCSRGRMSQPALAQSAGLHSAPCGRDRRLSCSSPADENCPKNAYPHRSDRSASGTELSPYHRTTGLQTPTTGHVTGSKPKRPWLHRSFVPVESSLSINTGRRIIWTKAKQLVSSAEAISGVAARIQASSDIFIANCRR